MPLCTLTKRLLRWKDPTLHFVTCLVIALVLTLAVDGYKALDGPGSSRRNNGNFTFRSSDIISLLSAAMIVLTITAAAWSSAVLWRSAHDVWTRHYVVPKHGLGPSERAEVMNKTVNEMHWIVSYKLQRWTENRFKNRQWQDLVVALALLPIIPQLISAPLLEGSLDWKSSQEFGAKASAASANPTANFARWRYYAGGEQSSSPDIKIAAGLAGTAWQNATAPDSPSRSKRCRHVVNNNRFPVGSALHNATVPCIVIHSVSWPDSPAPNSIIRVFNNSKDLSLSGDDSFASVDSPGIAVLFDPTNTTLKVYPPSRQRNSSLLLRPAYPNPLLFSGKMIAIVHISKRYLYEPQLLDPFGYSTLNNSIARGEIYDFELGKVFNESVYTRLEVEFTAGVSTPESSTYISHRVVESGPSDPIKSDIQPGPWVKEALYLMSDVMTAVAIMNNTSLNTWNDLTNYTENLIRASYQGSWDMLHARFDQNSTNLTVTLAEPRLQASVSKPRVAGWLTIHLLFALTAIPVWFLEGTDDARKNINDPTDFILYLKKEVSCNDQKDGNGEGSDEEKLGFTAQTRAEESLEQENRLLPTDAKS
ncbi:hypothetical protein BCR34DRAFT_489018 [Clohesyomyces aquaticus]|uniref:Uncharacterized protein n=1 Tax=Clohesyomyces aquaticus TaxID=1231657 RepID=A0A1Y1ZCN3_9PLEO|nr:hypothetical protein BCR34DRAFT_489018 [Clohesyomyces aquaticus]